MAEFNLKAEIDKAMADRIDHLSGLLSEARNAIGGRHSNIDLRDRIDAALAGAAVQPSAAPHDNKANVSVRCPDCDDGAYKGTDRICLTCNGLGELRRATFPTPPAQPSAARSLILTGKQLRELLDFCDDEPECEVTVEYREPFVDIEDGEKMPAGLYAIFTEYPEDGFIGPLGVTANPTSEILSTTAKGG